MKIKVIKLFEDSLLPKRAHSNDAGADVYSRIDITIYPGDTVAVPLGIALELPAGLAAIVQDKSSLSSNGLLNANAPIDSGYTGEIHAIVTNTTKEFKSIKKAQKIGQLVIFPIILATFVENIDNNRKNNNFGSTGLY